MKSAQNELACTIDRKTLLAALERVARVVPKRCQKVILTGVQLEASDGELHLAGTDFDISISASVACAGDLAPCVVPCQELIRRIKLGKSAACTLTLGPQGATIIINGGHTDHILPTFDPKEYPPVRGVLNAHPVLIAVPEFRSAMSTALLATASEPTRYAINGVLLEASEKGARFVATDGRRLVVCDLQKFEATDEVSAILPERLAALAARMADPKSEEAVALRVKIHPAEGDNVQSQDLSVEGSRWTLSMRQDVGAFPRYRDIFPESHSRFAVQRRPLLDLIKEVAAATDLENTAVRLEMSADTIRVTGRAFDGCESSGTVQAEFLGGGDEHVITGFRPKFLADAISSLPDDRIVIDVQQNSPRSITGTVVQHPAVVRGEDSDGILWVIMPINLGLEPSAATLGSNYTDDDASESTESCSLASAATG